MVDVDVGALEVVMDVDEIKGASIAGVEEIRQIVQTRCTTAICHGGGSKLGLPSKRLHVSLVDGSGITGFKVRLSSIIRLVGSEELSDAGVLN